MTTLSHLALWMLACSLLAVHARPIGPVEGAALLKSPTVTDLSGNQSAVPAGFGRGFVLAPEGQSCKAACSGVGAQDAVFQSVGGQSSSALCAVKTPSDGYVSGYQSSEAGTSCTAAVGGQMVISNRYACLCMAADQTQGLAEPQAASCSTACNNAIDQQTGQGVQADASLANYACLPLSDMGMDNRFGVVTAGSKTCAFANGSVVSTANDFSCVCLYTAARAASAVAADALAQPARTSTP